MCIDVIAHNYEQYLTNFLNQTEFDLKNIVEKIILFSFDLMILSIIN